MFRGFSVAIEFKKTNQFNIDLYQHKKAEFRVGIIVRGNVEL